MSQTRKKRPTTTQAGRTTYVSLPYIRGVSERIGRVLAPLNIKIANNSKPTLREKLVGVKDCKPKEQQKGAIYKTACECGATYIGETGRTKRVRLKEHVAALKHGRGETSPLAEHWLECRKPFDPSKASTLAIERTWSRRIIREAIEIHLQAPSLNQGVGKASISPIWDSVLYRTS